VAKFSCTRSRARAAAQLSSWRTSSATKELSCAMASKSCDSLSAKWSPTKVSCSSSRSTTSSSSHCTNENSGLGLAALAGTRSIMSLLDQLIAHIFGFNENSFHTFRQHFSSARVVCLSLYLLLVALSGGESVDACSQVGDGRL